MSSALVIVGAGGHARVLADALLAAGAQVLGFTDADPASHGREFFGVTVLGGDDVLARWSPDAIALVNGIGGVGEPGPSRRERVQASLEAHGWHFAGVRHPAATISRYATLADDVQVLAKAVVQAGARIARGCIVNTGAIVEHDVQLGEFAHVAPGAVLCGDVRVGDGAHIGAAAVVKQGIELGAGTRVGAGAVVVRAFAGNGTLTGVPARPREGQR